MTRVLGDVETWRQSGLAWGPQTAGADRYRSLARSPGGARVARQLPASSIIKLRRTLGSTRGVSLAGGRDTLLMSPLELW